MQKKIHVQRNRVQLILKNKIMGKKYFGVMLFPALLLKRLLP